MALVLIALGDKLAMASNRQVLVDVSKLEKSSSSRLSRSAVSNGPILLLVQLSPCLDVNQCNESAILEEESQNQRAYNIYDDYDYALLRLTKVLRLAHKIYFFKNKKQS